MMFKPLSEQSNIQMNECPNDQWMNHKKMISGILMTGLMMPVIALADVENTLKSINGKLVDTILPLVAIFGLVLAALSFVVGSENAKRHLILAIMGAAIGFGASSIVDFIKTMIH